MRKITLIDIFNPTKLRDWLNELMEKGGPKGDTGEQGPKGDTGVGIQSITSSQDGNVVTVTTTLTDGSTQVYSFNVGVENDTGV